MNILKRFIKKLKKQNPYVEKETENADIIINDKENLTREQRKKRFNDWYSYKKNHKL
jgi:hypothetical protein